MTVCATLTITDSLPPEQDCTGNNHCNIGCPQYFTSECQSLNPCVNDPCAKGCPDTALCGFCGNPSCVEATTAYCAGGADPNGKYNYRAELTDTENPPSAARILELEALIEERKCAPGCPDSTTCGKCNNDPCSVACDENPCMDGCPSLFTCGKDYIVGSDTETDDTSSSSDTIITNNGTTTANTSNTSNSGSNGITTDVNGCDGMYENGEISLKCITGNTTALLLIAVGVVGIMMSRRK